MHQAGDLAFRAFYAHSSGQRVFTDAPIAQAVRAQHPGQPLHIVPTAAVDGGGDLLAFALAGHARAEPAADAALEGQQPLEYRVYVPDPKRVGGGPGAFATRVALGKYVYTWREREYVVYVVSGRDGTEPYGKLDRQFVVGGHEHGHAVDELVRAVSLWTAEVRDAVLVFDHGYWQPSRELYAAVRRASWDDVILDEEMKRGIQNDVLRFFDAEERYRKLRVPWRRGEIYYGPPGNGKTVSLKALMNTLYSRKDPIPTLYVRTLSSQVVPHPVPHCAHPEELAADAKSGSFAGPEYSIKQIFTKARQMAPCLLVLEDLDSLVTDSVRSYFLNEVDGLQSNDGVLIIGSTNHLERLDPGISKRPSRFDRKYLFPKPRLAQRVQYCEFWRAKLADNRNVEFPARLCGAIAGITDDFSFAYMQEAFVASLLSIAAEADEGEEEDRGEDGKCEETGHGRDGDEGLEKLVLWRKMREQVRLLRDEM